MWRLNSIILNKQCIEEEIKHEIKNYPETNENGNTTLQNVWDAAKATIKFCSYEGYLKKQEKSKIKYLNLHLMKLEKEE